MRTLGTVNQLHYTKSRVTFKHVIAGFHCTVSLRLTCRDAVMFLNPDEIFTTYSVLVICSVL